LIKNGFVISLKKSESRTGKSIEEEHIDCGQWRKLVSEIDRRLGFEIKY